MHPLRKRRLLVVVFILVVSSIGVALATYALRQNMNFFYTPSQVAADSVPGDVRIRVGGMVVRGSLTRTPGDLGVNFRLTDGNAELAVRYTGILPDLFGEGEAAVAAGYLRSGRVLEADQVLAKHDENYTPPEVADAMKAGHAARAARAARDTDTDTDTPGSSAP